MIGFLFERLIGWLGDRGPVGGVLIAVIGVAAAVSLLRDFRPRPKGSSEH